MILSERQKVWLVQVLTDTCKRDITGTYSLPIEHRCKLLEEILNQQDKFIRIDSTPNYGIGEEQYELKPCGCGENGSCDKCHTREVI